MFYIISYIPFVLVLGFVVYLLYSRSKFKNRKGGGAFFFENDCLVLNTGLPYAIPYGDIDYVQLKYSSWELEHQMSYGLTVRVFKKNGKRKTVFYKGYGTAKLAYPADMAAALEANGIRCEMFDGYKSK